MPRFSDAISEIGGKTVTDVVIAEDRVGNGRTQLFLVFSDNTSFEFWAASDGIKSAKSMDVRGLEELLSLLAKDDRKLVVHQFPASGEQPILQQKLW